MNQDSQCSICYEKNNKNSIRISCGHIFHIKCLDTLNYYQLRKCPYCRTIYDIPIYSRLRSKKKYFQKIHTIIRKAAKTDDQQQKCILITDAFGMMNNNFRILRFHISKKLKHVCILKISEIEMTIISNYDYDISVQAKTSCLKLLLLLNKTF